MIAQWLLLCSFKPAVLVRLSLGTCYFCIVFSPFIYHKRASGRLLFWFSYYFLHCFFCFHFYHKRSCFLTLCYDSNSKFINCDGFAKTSQVLGSFMTKSINRHCVMGLIDIVADPWRYLKTLRKFRQKSSQIKWFLVVKENCRLSFLIFLDWWWHTPKRWKTISCKLIINF